MISSQSPWALMTTSQRWGAITVLWTWGWLAFAGQSRQPGRCGRWCCGLLVAELRVPACPAGPGPRCAAAAPGTHLPPPGSGRGGAQAAARRGKAAAGGGSARCGVGRCGCGAGWGGAERCGRRSIPGRGAAAPARGPGGAGAAGGAESPVRGWAPSARIESVRSRGCCFAARFMRWCICVYFGALTSFMPGVKWWSRDEARQWNLRIGRRFCKGRWAGSTMYLCGRKAAAPEEGVALRSSAAEQPGINVPAPGWGARCSSANIAKLSVNKMCPQGITSTLLDHLLMIKWSLAPLLIQAFLVWWKLWGNPYGRGEICSWPLRDIKWGVQQWKMNENGDSCDCAVIRNNKLRKNIATSLVMEQTQKCNSMKHQIIIGTDPIFLPWIIDCKSMLPKTFGRGRLQ